MSRSTRRTVPFGARGSSSLVTSTMNSSPPEVRLALHVSLAKIRNGISTPYFATVLSLIPGPNARQFFAAVLAKYLYRILFTVQPSLLMFRRISTSTAPNSSKLGVAHVIRVASTNVPGEITSVLPVLKHTSIFSACLNCTPWIVISVSPNTGPMSGSTLNTAYGGPMMGDTLSCHVSPSQRLDHPPNIKILHVFGSYVIAASSRAAGGSPIALGVVHTMLPQSITSTWFKKAFGPLLPVKQNILWFGTDSMPISRWFAMSREYGLGFSLPSSSHVIVSRHRWCTSPCMVMLSRPPKTASLFGNHVVLWSNRGVGPLPLSAGFDHVGATAFVAFSSSAVPKSRTCKSSHDLPCPAYPPKRNSWFPTSVAVWCARGDGMSSASLACTLSSVHVFCFVSKIQTSLCRTRWFRPPTTTRKCFTAVHVCLDRGEGPAPPTSPVQLSNSELFKSSACRSPSAHALPSLRPTPPNKYALVPTTVNVCPERGSGGVPFRGAGSHVTDCEGGKRGQSRPVHRVGIDRGVALVVDGRVGRGRRAPDAATTRPKRDCLKRERAI